MKSEYIYIAATHFADDDEDWPVSFRHARVNATTEQEAYSLGYDAVKPQLEPGEMFVNDYVVRAISVNEHGSTRAVITRRSS